MQRFPRAVAVKTSRKNPQIRAALACHKTGVRTLPFSQHQTPRRVGSTSALAAKATTTSFEPSDSLAGQECGHNNPARATGLHALMQRFNSLKHEGRADMATIDWSYHRPG